MNSMERPSLLNWRLIVALGAVIALIAVAAFTFASNGPAAQAAAPKKVTIWFQTTDSCKQALSGATFKVIGPGTNAITAATNGTTPRSLSSHVCPIQRSTCAVNAGCTSIVLNAPSSGTSTYRATVWQTAPGKAQTGNAAYGANWTYAACEGGSDCSQRELATIRVTSSGAVSATVLNIYPDGTSVTWPATGGTYNGSKTDPIMFHEFGISQTSGPANQCDGNHDADDYLTGTPGGHCRSTSGRKVPVLPPPPAGF